MNTSQWTAFGAQCDDRVTALLAGVASQGSLLEAGGRGTPDRSAAASMDAAMATPEDIASLLMSAGFGGAEVDEDADFVLPELLEPLS